MMYRARRMMGTILFSPRPEASLAKPVNQVCIRRPHPPGSDVNLIQRKSTKSCGGDARQGRTGRRTDRLVMCLVCLANHFCSSPRDLG